MIGADKPENVVRMTGLGLAIIKSRRAVISNVRLRVAVMMTMIVSENDAHAVVVTVRHTHGMFAIRRREQNRNARNDVVPGAKKSQEAQTRREAMEPWRALCSGFHRRRTVGRDTFLVKMAHAISLLGLACERFVLFL